MLAPWAIDEMKTADLKDKRLNARLTKILSALGERPTASIPAACGGWEEMVAAYRFFDNEKVTFQRVLKPHIEQTLKRVAAQPVALLVQDTTELDLTRPELQVVGAGPLDSSTRRGALLHPLIAFTPDGTPLGLCAAKIWARKKRRKETPAEKRRRRKRTHIKDKESRRWIDTLRQARKVAAQAPGTQCVCIADSEADIYELFSEPLGGASIQWIVRACQNRALAKDGKKESDAARNIREAVESQPVQFVQEISVRGRAQPKVSCETRGRRQPREGRMAQVEIRAVTVTLRGPPRPDGRLPDVVVNVVQVREIDPPNDDVPVEWLLITPLPIANVEQVREIIQYYTVRFLIEVFFRVLKSGCRVEKRRFADLKRLLPCVAVYLIVAWRTLMICRLGRSCPDLDCETIFEPAEWKSVWMTVTRTKPPRRPPTLAEILPLIAQLGGYVNYPNRQDPPGPQTIWLGMQRMYDLATAWNTFGPGAEARQDE